MIDDVVVSAIVNLGTEEEPVVETVPMTRQPSENSLLFTLASVPAFEVQGFVLSESGLVFNGRIVTSVKTGNNEHVEWPGIPPLLFFVDTLNVSLPRSNTLSVELKRAEDVM